MINWRAGHGRPIVAVIAPRDEARREVNCWGRNNRPNADVYSHPSFVTRSDGGYDRTVELHGRRGQGTILICGWLGRSARCVGRLIRTRLLFAGTLAVIG